jgi:hypothetical protein
MEFKAKRKDLVITIEEQSFTIKSPTIGQFEKLQQATVGQPTEKLFSLYKKWLIEIGLPSEALEQLDKDDFLGLVQFISEPKKK